VVRDADFTGGQQDWSNMHKWYEMKREGVSSEMVKMENKPFSFICSRGTRMPHLCARSEGARLMTDVVPVVRNAAPLRLIRGGEDIEM
jgi:hypothetical protein